MTPILDIKRPHTELDEGTGGEESPGPDFIEQDHVIFAWSEGNCRYEEAWWLSREANQEIGLVKHLLATRRP